MVLSVSPIGKKEADDQADKGYADKYEFTVFHFATGATAISLSNLRTHISIASATIT